VYTDYSSAFVMFYVEISGKMEGAAGGSGRDAVGVKENGWEGVSSSPSDYEVWGAS